MLVPCCCGGCTATINGKLLGCNLLALPSTTVEAHDATAGGTLLASTTTDASGNYTFTSIAATSGNAIVIVPAPHSRFVAVNRTLAWTSGTPGSTQWGCGKTTPTANTTQTPASGYHCWPGCLYPVADTLHGTDTWFGTFTLTNSGSGWVLSPGNVSYSYPGCFGCPAKTVTVSFSALEWHWTATGGGCPDDAAIPLCNTVSSGTTTCFVPSVSAFGISVTWPAGSPTVACLASMFCHNSSPPTQTTTITE